MPNPDFKRLADDLYQQLQQRQLDRSDLELQWEEVDRQVRMEPAPRDALTPSWIPEFELPLQADALEVLCADADRMQFPDSYEWFLSHAEMTSEYFKRLEKDFGIVENVEPVTFSQEDVNAISEAALIHAHKQYDFRGAVNQINAEAFRYGTFAARVRNVKRSTFTNDFRGISSQAEDLPMLIPMSIKNVYLDDKCDNALHQGTMIGPVQFYQYTQNINDVKAAAKKGSSDTKSMSGGWKKRAVANLKPKDNKGDLLLFEAEGDVVIPSSRNPMFLPNVIVTVCVDHGGPKVIRFRENGMPFHSLLHGTYFKDKIGVYGTSPLMKGEPIQKSATMLMTNIVEISVLNARPPVAYNPGEVSFRAEGGPQIEPNALWKTFSGVEPQYIGKLDHAQLSYAATVKQYEEVTGVSAMRSGGQTKSHQTAFAVNKEDERGQTRTVAYVKNTARSFLTNLLNMELAMLRKSMKRQAVYIPRYEGYIDMSKDSIPDNATFQVLGAAGPFEKRQRAENQVAAMSALMSVEQLKLQTQQPGKPLNLQKIQEAMLTAAEIPESSVSDFFLEEQQPQQPPQGQLPGPQNVQ